MVHVSIPAFAGSEDIEGPDDITCVLQDFGEMRCSGLKFKSSLTHFWQGAVGGIDTKNADRINGLYDLDACYLIHAEQSADNQGDYILLGLSSRMAFGEGLSDSKVESFFNINNGAKGDQDIYIDKAYVEFTALDRMLTFNVGKLGMKTYFDNNAVANKYRSQFFAYPLVHSPNIPFPGKGPAVRVKFAPSEAWYIQAAVADGNAQKRTTGFSTAFDDESDMVVMAEAGICPKFNGRQGNYRFMTWFQDEKSDYLDGSGRTKSDDAGFSMSFDQELSERFTAFFRYGWANDKVNELEDFFSFGGQIKEPIEGREDDVFGVGYANGLRSPYDLDAGDKRQISLVETYYNIKINKNMKISPNYQLVFNPGGQKGQSPASVFGVRCRVKF